MNAAAKAINQTNMFSGNFLELEFSKEWWLLITLLLSVLVSALLVVYSTNAHRSSFSELQRMEQEAHQLKLQWGQLLLEQASLATPARVEILASQKLRMQLPRDKQTFVLQAQ